MNNNYIDDIILENTRIIHRNFEGRAGQYNRAGDRSFSAVIAPELVDSLREQGWQVRELPPREGVDGAESLYVIPVRVNFESNRPPRIALAMKNNLVELDKDTVKTLDQAEIVKVDCSLHPHKWENNGKSGVKAYLRSMFVTIREDTLAEKYEAMYSNAPQFPEEN